MKILITNDDSIFAPGLHHLAKAAQKYGEVLVVAPDRPRSGQSHAVTITEPIRLSKYKEEDGIEYYICSGTPVDCVKLAIKVILKCKRPDIIFSGINHGANTSTNVIYSGTMAAAIEGGLMKVPAVGFSLIDHGNDAEFSHVLPYLDKIMQKAINLYGKGENVCWNVNFPKYDPSLGSEQIKGIRMCTQADAMWEEDADERIDTSGNTYYWLSGKFDTEGHPECTDLCYINKNYVTVVPVITDWTDYKAFETQSEFINE